MSRGTRYRRAHGGSSGRADPRHGFLVRGGILGWGLVSLVKVGGGAYHARELLTRRSGPAEVVTSPVSWSGLTGRAALAI